MKKPTTKKPNHPHARARKTSRPRRIAGRRDGNQGRNRAAPDHERRAAKTPLSPGRAHSNVTRSARLLSPKEPVATREAGPFPGYRRRKPSTVLNGPATWADTSSLAQGPQRSRWREVPVHCLAASSLRRSQQNPRQIGIEDQQDHDANTGEDDYALWGSGLVAVTAFDEPVSSPLSSHQRDSTDRALALYSSPS
jgi:hypothetical protein